MTSVGTTLRMQGRLNMSLSGFSERLERLLMNQVGVVFDSERDRDIRGTAAD